MAGWDRWRKLNKTLPNPALAPLGNTGPFYAQRVVARCFGTKGGPVIDDQSKVEPGFHSVGSGLGGSGGRLGAGWGPARGRLGAGGGPLGGRVRGRWARTADRSAENVTERSMADVNRGLDLSVFETTTGAESDSFRSFYRDKLGTPHRGLNFWLDVHRPDVLKRYRAYADDATPGGAGWVAADTLREVADKLGIDADGLSEQVDPGVVRGGQRGGASVRVGVPGRGRDAGPGGDVRPCGGEIGASGGWSFG